MNETNNTTPDKKANLLALCPGAKACVNCGYCCRTSACPFGTWDEARHRCSHLTDDNRCGVYNEILARPHAALWHLAPAFGAGCCSPLNPDRRVVMGKK